MIINKSAFLNKEAIMNTTVTHKNMTSEEADKDLKFEKIPLSTLLSLFGEDSQDLLKSSEESTEDNVKIANDEEEQLAKKSEDTFKCNECYKEFPMSEVHWVIGCCREVFSFDPRQQPTCESCRDKGAIWLAQDGPNSDPGYGGYGPF